METQATSAQPQAAAVPPADAAGWRVAVLRTPEEIASIRSQWQALRPQPNADPDFVLLVVRSRREVVRPHVVALFRGERLEGLLVGRLEDVEYRCTFGYATVFRTTVRSITIVTGGQLRATPDVPWAPLVRSLRDEVRQGTAHCVWFRSLETDSDLLAHLRAEVPALWRSDPRKAQPHWRLDLPTSFDEVMKRISRNHRKSFRRYRRRYDEEFPGRYCFRRTKRAEEVRDLCLRLEATAKETYLRGLGAGFVHDELTEARLVLAASRGRLESWELEVDGKVRAFWVGDLCDGVLYLDFTGHDSEFSFYQPGTVLLVEGIKDMIEAGATAIDYGIGHAEYKRRFHARSWDEFDVIVFPPGVRSLWLNGVRGTVGAVERFAAACAAKLQLRDRVKRLLRTAAKKRAVAEEPKGEDAGEPDSKADAG